MSRYVIDKCNHSIILNGFLQRFSIKKVKIGPTFILTYSTPSLYQVWVYSYGKEGAVWVQGKVWSMFTLSFKFFNLRKVEKLMKSTYKGLSRMKTAFLMIYYAFWKSLIVNKIIKALVVKLLPWKLLVPVFASFRHCWIGIRFDNRTWNYWCVFNND